MPFGTMNRELDAWVSDTLLPTLREYLIRMDHGRLSRNHGGRVKWLEFTPQDRVQITLTPDYVLVVVTSDGDDIAWLVKTFYDGSGNYDVESRESSPTGRVHKLIIRRKAQEEC